MSSVHNQPCAVHGTKIFVFVNFGITCKTVCIGKKDQTVVILLWQGILTYIQSLGDKGSVEESVTSGSCAVSTCEVNNEHEEEVTRQ